MELTEILTRMKEGDDSAPHLLFLQEGQAVFARFFAQSGDRERSRALTQEVFGDLQRLCLTDPQRVPDAAALRGVLDELIGRRCSAPNPEETPPPPVEPLQPASAAVRIQASQEPAPAGPQAAHSEIGALADKYAVKREPVVVLEQTDADPVQMDEEPDPAPIAPQEMFREPAEIKTAASKRQSVGMGRSVRYWLCFVLLICCILVLLWAVAGMAMGFGWLPQLDLGYSWFNENVCSMF